MRAGWLKRRTGYSLAEAMVSLGIFMVAMGLASGGWLFMVKGEKANSTQAELDFYVRKTIERLRSKLRLSSLEKVVFYQPPTADHFTAISFPLAIDNDHDGLIEMLNDTNIIWDQTVIYHVWNRTPEQLLCTTFSPRDNTLTDAQVREQLAYVVANGHGTGTYGGENATTEVLFENLFEWKLWPKGSTFDSYSTTLKRELVPFGSVIVGPGSHSVSFRVTGKNPSSSGYKVGLDYIRASGSGSDREAEWQTVATQPSSVAAARQFMSQGSWGDNYQLAFPATATNQQMSFSLENDCWEETSFLAPGCSFDGVSLKHGAVFGTSVEENYVSMDGTGTTWTAETQVIGSNTLHVVSDNEYDKCAIRVLMKGANIQDGGFIKASGQYPSVRLVAPPFFGGETYRRTKIKAISIGIADDTNGYASAMNVRTNTLRQMTLGSEVLSTYQWAWPSPLTPFYQIDRTNTYAVTFYIESYDFFHMELGQVAYREDSSTNRIHCYVLTNATTADVMALNWSSKPGVRASNRLPCVYELSTYYPSNASFTSGIFDTTRANPAFTDIVWNRALGYTGSGYSDTPGSTALRFKVRSGDDPYLSDAPGWSNAPLFTTSGSTLASVGSGRYVQFQTLFTSDVTNSPVMRDVKIRWPGDARLVDISAMVTRGPEYGEFEVKVDGTNLYKGVRIDLTIFRDITGYGGRTNRMTSSMMAEVTPRNSGK